MHADGRSPLHLAALKGHSSVVRFLLGKQAWADSQDAEDSTALHLAARSAIRSPFPPLKAPTLFGFVFIVFLLACTQENHELHLDPLHEDSLQSHFSLTLSATLFQALGTTHLMRMHIIGILFYQELSSVCTPDPGCFANYTM